MRRLLEAYSVSFRMLLSLNLQVLSLIACGFMEVLQPDVLDTLDADDLSLLEFFKDFSNEFWHYLGFDYGLHFD